MGIRTLRIFKTVCAEGSITKAAQKLYMSQPAVSKAIKELEQERGYPLFDRLSRKVFLTEPGRRLLEKTEDLLRLYDDINSLDGSVDREFTIRIGSCITVACDWLPGALKQYMDKNPDVKIRTQVAAAEAIIGLLMENKIDLAFLEGPYTLDGCHAKTIDSYHLIAVCAKDHPYADGRKIGIDGLFSQPLLLREKGSAVRDAFDGWAMMHKRKALPEVESVNTQALIQFVKAGMGIAVLADKVTLPEIERGAIFEVNVPDMKIVNDTSLVYRESKYIAKQLQEFIDMAEDKGKVLGTDTCKY